MRLSTDEKPTSAPSSWSAWAIPHAIEWSLATPKMSAVFPSSSPIPSSLHVAVARQPTIEPMTADRRPAGLARRRCAACARFAPRRRRRHRPAGEAVPGRVEAIRPLEARGIPFRIVTKLLAVQPRDARGWFATAALSIPPGPDSSSALSATAAYTARHYPGRPLYRPGRPTTPAGVRRPAPARRTTRRTRRRRDGRGRRRRRLARGG